MIMGQSKQTITVEITAQQLEWLTQMREQYKLPDTGKAMRIVLEYARSGSDLDSVFKKIRCKQCG